MDVGCSRALSLSLSLSPQGGVLRLSSTHQRREIMKHLPPHIHVVINNEGPSMPLYATGNDRC